MRWYNGQNSGCHGYMVNTYMSNHWFKAILLLKSLHSQINKVQTHYPSCALKTSCQITVWVQILGYLMTLQWLFLVSETEAGDALFLTTMNQPKDELSSQTDGCSSHTGKQHTEAGEGEVAKVTLVGLGFWVVCLIHVGNNTNLYSMCYLLNLLSWKYLLSIWHTVS